jgi:hypothetical protein
VHLPIGCTVSGRSMQSWLEPIHSFNLFIKELESQRTMAR